jgi:hypothetical protein
MLIFWIHLTKFAIAFFAIEYEDSHQDVLVITKGLAKPAQANERMEALPTFEVFPPIWKFCL